MAGGSEIKEVFPNIFWIMTHLSASKILMAPPPQHNRKPSSEKEYNINIFYILIAPQNIEKHAPHWETLD